MKPLEINDEFIVITNSVFFNVDKKAILFLYQPLVGHIGVILYFFLLEISYYRGKEKLNHSLILEYCQINIYEFMIARRSLESFGLIVTYYDEDIKLYTLSLYPPLTPKTFLQRKTFNKKISTLISKKNLEIFRDTISLNSKKEHKGINVSSSLDENLFLTQQMDEIYKINSFSRKKINIHFINYDWLFRITKSAISKNEDLPKIFRIVEGLRFIYSIKYSVITKLIRDSLIDNKIDYHKLKRNSKNIIKNKDNISLPKNKNNFLNNKNVKIGFLKKQMIEMNIYEFYTYIYKKEPDRILLGKFDILIDKYNLTPEVFNCLLQFSHIKNKKYVHNYILKISETIQKQNIYNLDELIDHLANSIKKSQNKDNIKISDESYFKILLDK